MIDLVSSNKSALIRLSLEDEFREAVLYGYRTGLLSRGPVLSDKQINTLATKGNSHKARDEKIEHLRKEQTESTDGLGC